MSERYVHTGTIVGPGMPGEFHRSLVGLALGPGQAGRDARATRSHDAVYALGDGEVRVFEAAGRLTHRWAVGEQALCLAVASNGRLAVGARGRVDLYGDQGERVGGFTVGAREKLAEVTALRFVHDALLVADASGRVIRRFGFDGVEQGVIGAQHKTGGFMLPNKSLDFDVDVAGIVHATDSGRHQVTSWSLDGTMVGAFGKFGMAKPEDFVGCCNPVNVAVAPDGRLVTSEKVAARVKVFGKDRALLAVIGPEHFDPMCRHIHVAVDSAGRIVAADPERRTIAVFERV